MPERQSKPDILPHKKTIKLTPSIGDWTTYHPPRAYAKRIKSGLYGFDRLSEERLNKALLIHYDLTRELLQLLQINLMLGSEFYAISAEQTNYLNFLRTANYPLLNFQAFLPEWHGAVSVCLDLALVNTLINQSLGSKDTDPLSRKLTDLEEALITIIIKDYLLMLLEKHFKKVLGEITLGPLNSPDIVAEGSLNPSTAFVYFNIEVSLADNPPAKIQIGYNGNLLKNILKKIEETPDTRPLPLTKLPPPLLNSISIPIAVTLGITEVETEELKEMEEGDAVSLDNTLSSPVIIKIGEQIELLGQPGKTGKKMSCKIISLEKEERIKIEAVPTLDTKEELAPKAEIPLEEEPKEDYYTEENTQTEEEETAPLEEVNEEEYGTDDNYNLEENEELLEEPFEEEAAEEEEEEQP